MEQTRVPKVVVKVRRNPGRHTGTSLGKLSGEDWNDFTGGAKVLLLS